MSCGSEWEAENAYIANKLSLEIARKSIELGRNIGKMESEIENKSQKGEWIPVSEKLPNRNGCYNVTRIIEGTAISDVCYFDGQNTWHRDTGVNHGRPYLTDIIAWQPLPEPYKEGGAV